MWNAGFKNVSAVTGARVSLRNVGRGPEFMTQPVNARVEPRLKQFCFKGLRAPGLSDRGTTVTGAAVAAVPVSMQRWLLTRSETQSDGARRASGQRESRHLRDFFCAEVTERFPTWRKQAGHPLEPMRRDAHDFVPRKE